MSYPWVGALVSCASDVRVACDTKAGTGAEIIAVVAWGETAFDELTGLPLAFQINVGIGPKSLMKELLN